MSITMAFERDVVKTAHEPMRPNAIRQRFAARVDRFGADP
jgi:hypothetical protein